MTETRAQEVVIYEKNNYSVVFSAVSWTLWKIRNDLSLVKRQARNLIPLWLPEDIDDIPLQIGDPEDTKIVPYQLPEEEEDPSNSNA
ncbi:hypothetical protein FCM35_KLT08791 [Carex littledalei]|uniref:Uncharacterized protein n=1 Tax=Carex littledalei TaxID=544730 RepID=A0A833QPQ8_9POAL|nr:hypothetical protein FCM35_KLT08791 [Carex littledalei]